jgi:hypothetical protein
MYLSDPLAKNLPSGEKDKDLIEDERPVKVKSFSVSSYGRVLCCCWKIRLQGIHWLGKNYCENRAGKV